MKLYYHPVSAYSQKVLMAFHEKEVSFEPQIVDLMDPEAREAYLKVNPFGKIPVLLLAGEERIIPESSIIIEYLDTHHDSAAEPPPAAKQPKSDPHRATLLQGAEFGAPAPSRPHGQRSRSLSSDPG